MFWPEMPKRIGARPRTTKGNPFLQITQLPPASIVAELLAWALTLPHVRSRFNPLTPAGTTALWLPPAWARGPSEAFLLAPQEFAHLRPWPEGSVLMTLPDKVRRQAILRGWCVLHPVARSGVLLSAAVLVFAPRQAAELEVLRHLLSISYEFAQSGKERYE